MSRLKGFLSGKSRKPVIVNGKLLMYKGSLVTLHREGYSVVCTYKAAGVGETTMDTAQCDIIIAEMVNKFNERYGEVIANNKDFDNELIASSDAFTGAIIIKNGLYGVLLDANDEFHFHDGIHQFPKPIRDVIEDFTKEFICNYFEIYIMLLNRRLMASYMPSKVKGHLVSGLFQPLVVGTKMIDCPMTLSEFQWFHSYINNPTEREEYLEHTFNTGRELDLSVIAMCDFAEVFKVPCIKELNRLYFLYILYSILGDSMFPGLSGQMMKRFHRIYNSINSNRADAEGVMIFFAECVQQFQRLRSQVAVIR